MKFELSEVDDWVRARRKRTDLIEEIERQLETRTVVEPIFTLRWSLTGADEAGGTV